MLDFNLILKSFFLITNKFFYKQAMDEKFNLTIKDFEIIKELGSGNFGKVKLVKKIST